MKTTKIWLFTIIFTILLSPFAHAAMLGTRSLNTGMRGDDVMELQQLLKKIGYFSVNPTGYYGNITQSSVTNFQRVYGLTANGNANLDTIHTLKYQNGIAAKSFAYARLLRRGMTGGDVKNLQEVLRRLGFFPSNVNATGFFGVLTETAVTDFQRNANITTDGLGIVGSATATALNNTLSKLDNNQNNSDPKKDSGNTNQNQTYTVKQGDTLWGISQMFKVSIIQLQQTNSIIGSNIYPGQQLIISSNNTPRITYKNYTVKSGDTIWSIANNHGLRDIEVVKANGFTSQTTIFIGQVIKIPVFNIPVKSTPGSQFGELLDWWSEAQYVVPFNVTFTVIDFYTGTSFKAVRTYGANHADCEPLTAQDTAIMLNLWNNNHTSYWAARPVIISINGRRLAASMTAMLHAGLDAYPNGAYVNNRSGGYGSGINFDAIKGNNADGHFDIYFLNSTRHVDGNSDSTHQANVKIAAGVK